MDEEAKRRIAEFRFGVIADLVGRKRLSRGEKERLLEEKSGSQWEIPSSGRCYISRSTILHWVRRYERSGSRLESLYPEERANRGQMRALDEETALALRNLKKELRGATLPVVIRQARARKILPPGSKVSRATLYRFFKREGLMEEDSPAQDRRRFEAELPNDIWQSDVMHSLKVEAEGKRRKTYLFAFLDDMSRLVPHAEFYLQERLDSFIDALRKALKKRSLPRKLYVDNSPTFRSHHLGHVTASLGIALVHSRPYQPEGRGKIERFFRTIRMQFLSVMPEGLSLEELNRRLQEWLDKEYHCRLHSSTNETPLARYLQHVHLLREAPKDLDDYFRKRTIRKVYKDRTVSLLGKLYEAPVELIGKTVTLFYHEDDPSRVEVFFSSTSYGMLLPLDLHVNCRIRRHQKITEIVSEAKDKTFPPQDIPYRGGQLFRKGEDDDQL